MTTIRRFVLRLLSFFRPGAAEAELSREIHSHLQLLEDEFVSKGMSRDEARLAARRAFGGVEQAKEHQRDARGFRWLDNSRMDFKLGARMLAKYPGLSLIGGAGLAVGVAIGAGFFAFFYSFLYATLPVEGGERIVALENWDIDANNEMRRSMHDLVMWQREMKTVGEIGAFRTIARNVTFAGGSAEAVQVAQITAAGFNITRVTPVIGRAIVAADESAGASPIVVIGYDVWHSRFGGDASVLGRELRLGNVVHTIVGVMPEGYGFPVNHSYWIPLSTDAAAFGPREGPDIFIFGRLRDGVAMAQAQAELSALGAQAASAFPLTHARLQPRVMPYAHPILDIQGSHHPRLHGDAVADQHAGADRRRQCRRPGLRPDRHATTGDRRSNGSGRQPPPHCRSAVHRSTRAQRGSLGRRHRARQIRHRTGFRHLCRRGK